MTPNKIPCLLTLFATSLIGTSLYAQVEVTPSNMGNWTFQTLYTPDGGNTYDNCNTTPSSACALSSGSMVTGPASPPFGTGSANLQTGNGTAGGDSGIALGTSDFNGVSLSALTALSYSTYDTLNNGQQFPFLALNVCYDGCTLGDTLFFEPPYQSTDSNNPGNPSLPDQGLTAMNQWQQWNALEGGWWDNNGNCGPGENVCSLSTLIGDLGDAQIAADPNFPNDGVELQVGFASPGDQFNGYVDGLTVGVNETDTTYDFDPNAPTPEPSTFLLLGGGLLAGLIRKRRSVRSSAS